MSTRVKGAGRILFVAISYALVGVVTAELSGHAQSPQLRTAWRLAAWVLSLIIFVSHLSYERLRVGNTTTVAALRTAVAAALGAFALAAVGPVRSHWGAADIWRTVVLSLVTWPVLTGIPAFLVALLGGSVLGRVFRREPSEESSPAA